MKICIEKIILNVRSNDCGSYVSRHLCLWYTLLELFSLNSLRFLYYGEIREETKGNKEEREKESKKERMKKERRERERKKERKKERKTDRQKEDIEAVAKRCISMQIKKFSIFQRETKL